VNRLNPDVFSDSESIKPPALYSRWFPHLLLMGHSADPNGGRGGGMVFMICAENDTLGKAFGITIGLVFD